MRRAFCHRFRSSDCTSSLISLPNRLNSVSIASKTLRIASLASELSQRNCLIRLLRTRAQQARTRTSSSSSSSSSSFPLFSMLFARLYATQISFDSDACMLSFLFLSLSLSRARARSFVSFVCLLLLCGYFLLDTKNSLRVFYHPSSSSSFICLLITLYYIKSLYTFTNFSSLSSLASHGTFPNSN
jgi:hypothetical protein